MATAAHCAYCFECLSGSLEKRKPLSLHQVEALWEQYEGGNEDSDPAAAQLHAEAADGEMDEASDSAQYKPAAISRILNSPSSGSSSSSPSASSSTPSLSNTASKSSSRSSLFSLPKRLARGKKNSVADEEEYPLFVTWNTISSRGKVSLRGCIGTFEPHELEDGLRSYALTSAFEDTRFHPISARELSTLECGVTLLTHFEPIPDPMDWEIGTHGLRISFLSGNRRYGATYLPDVAREQGWTKDETMISLMRKAGWSGRSSEWRGVKDLNVVRYQGRRANLGFREWKGFREWIEKCESEGVDLDV